MDVRSLDQMLSELRATSQVAAGKPVNQSEAAGGVDFGQVLKSTLDQVNQAQQSAQQLTEDFTAGKTEATLQDVMVNVQKANLSFQQMVQVRNRLVSAYHDIMNMQV